MRIAAFLAISALLLTAAPLLAPTASASLGCDPRVPEVCVPCVFSVYNQPGCIVRNPCDPRYCDPYWP